MNTSMICRYICSNGYLSVPQYSTRSNRYRYPRLFSRAVISSVILSRWLSALGFVDSRGGDYGLAVDAKGKKRSESGDRDDLRQKSSGKNDTLPTMESNHKYRDGDGKRYTAKKEGHRLAGGERGPLSRCLFAIRSFFMVTRRLLGKGRICEAIVVAIGRVRA